MKILLTGASGFLGSAVIAELGINHNITTIGRSSENAIFCDLSVNIPELPCFDTVIHAAGKAHIVPKSEAEIQDFFKVNVEGTRNLLAGLCKCLPKTFVFISTVAVYGCDTGELIAESHALLGASPYAESKIKAESLVTEWGKNKNVPVIILRLPLISGVNPPGNLKAIANAIKKGYYVNIGLGDVRKSMVSAKEVALFIPSLYGKQGIFNLTDGIHPKMTEIENAIGQMLKKKIKKAPKWPIVMMARIGDYISLLPINSNRIEKLSSSLTFSDDKARNELKWNPKPALPYLFFNE